jgi:hypothetical protein
MFVPLLLDQVRVNDRPEVFLVFQLDQANKLAWDIRRKVISIDTHLKAKKAGQR